MARDNNHTYGDCHYCDSHKRNVRLFDDGILKFPLDEVVGVTIAENTLIILTRDSSLSARYDIREDAVKSYEQIKQYLK